MDERAAFCDRARRIVFDYIVERSTFPPDFELKDVFVVWFSKTLQNWKALVATHLQDQFYYEVTYNGDKNEAYLDVYDKIENVVIKY